MTSGSSFPNAIDSFVQHQDIYDDVEASDINKIQDAIVAIEETLGDAINTLQVVEDDVVVLTTDDATEQDTDTATILRFESLSIWLSALWNGLNVYAASASSTNKKFSVASSASPDLISLDSPSTADDPTGLWNGTGFTLRQSGFWVANGQVTVNLPTLTGSDSVRRSASPKNKNSLRVGSFNVNQHDSSDHVISDLVARIPDVDILMLQEAVNLDAHAFAQSQVGWAAFQLDPNDNSGVSNTAVLYRTALGSPQDTTSVFVGDAADTRQRFLNGVKFNDVWYNAVHLFPERDDVDNTGVINRIHNWSAAHPEAQIWGLDKNQVDIGTLESVTGLSWTGIDIDGFLTGNGAQVSGINAWPTGYSDHDGVHAQSNATVVYTGARLTAGDSSSGSPSDNFGEYLASIAVNKTNWNRALDYTYVSDKGQGRVVLNPVLVGWFPKGTRISLRARQNSNRSQTIDHARLSVYRVRGN